jgi:hypothetical protein
MSKKIGTDLDFESVARILNLPDPSAAQHPATKAYVDSAVEGLAWKDSARVATQSNLNLSSPGATIDGITMAANDRVLVRSQSSQPENGIYIWNGAAVAMSRSLDASTAAELEQAVITVEEGTSAAATFRQTTVNFTLESGNVVWATFGTSAAAATETTAGIAELATQSETDTGTDDARIVTPLKLANYANRAKRYSATFGDGSATQYTLTHNLGTRDVIVQIRRTGSPYDEVITDVEADTINSVVIRFASAPASNTMRATVLA